MTATRWWVRRLARWIARVNGVKAHIQMVSLAVTAFSTFSIMLQGFGLGAYVPYVGAAAAGGGIVYTYLYTEGGVWNQVQRDQADLSNDYADPNAYINVEMNTRALVAGLQGQPLDEEQREAFETELNEAYEELRDGIGMREAD
jgi:hypothetical protein